MGCSFDMRIRYELFICIVVDGQDGWFYFLKVLIHLNILKFTFSGDRNVNS